MNIETLQLTFEFIVTNLINVATEAVDVFSSFQALSPNSLKRITELSKGQDWKNTVDEIKRRYLMFCESTKTNEKIYAEGLGKALQLISALEKGLVKANTYYVKTTKKFSELLPNEKDEVLDIYDALDKTSQKTELKQVGTKAKIISAPTNLNEQIEFFKSLDTWESVKKLIAYEIDCGPSKTDDVVKKYYFKSFKIGKMLSAYENETITQTIWNR